MKKLLTLVALLSVLAVSNASAFFGRGCCKKETACAAPERRNKEACVKWLPTESEEAPDCIKRREVVDHLRPTKICKTTCHYVCPPETQAVAACDSNDNGY